MDGKLKTFKDLGTNPAEGSKMWKEYTEYELRQAIINWIKEFKKYSMDSEIIVDMAPNFHYSHRMRCGAILVLKQIFNITEEDLKND